VRRAWVLAVLLLFAPIGRADAADGCTFLTFDSTWTLEADCTVSASIVIPDGVTVDGNHHTITAIDPPGGFFRGGVIVSGGASANVTNTVITAVMMANVCQEGPDRLRAIFFNGASGVIRGNTVLNVNKESSNCQEGNGIEVRNIDLAGPAARVEISGNLIDGFQKTGIVVSGNVDATIRSNSIGPSLAQRFVVANGIQVGAGTRASIEGNTIAGNSWDGDDAAATAILLVNTAAGTVVSGNSIIGNADVGIYVMANGVSVERNRLTDNGPDGKFDVGIGNYGDNNVFEGNSITGFGIRYQNVAEPDGSRSVVAGLE